MELTTLLSFLAAVGLIFFGMVFDGKAVDFNRLNAFWDVSSVLITIGGTLAVTVMSFPISDIAGVPSQFKILIAGNKFNPKKYISILVDCATEARRKGILALEDKAAEQKDMFLQESIMLIVDAIEPEKVREILENELSLLDERHNRACKVYDKASSFAPGFGMIGTLLGLIAMLKGASLTAEGGSDAMVQGMATALITTLYGSLMANVIFVPIANKLRMRHAEELLCKEMIMEGVLAIGAGDNPKHIEERLYAYLKSSEKYKKNKASAAEGAEGGDGGKKPPDSKPAKMKK